MTKKKTQKKKLTKKTSAQVREKKKYAYTISDKAFGDFKVLNSANAWWIEKGKLHNFISVLKLDGTYKEACAYAGISKDQFDYFRELHPEFSLVEEACRQLPNLKARKTIVENLDQINNAHWYAERKLKNEFSERKEVDHTSKGEKIVYMPAEIANKNGINTSSEENSE